MAFSYNQWVQHILNGEPFCRADALVILRDPSIDILRLTAAAGEVRMATFGRKVKIHQINNIKNGFCPEDCGYCSQSRVSKAPIKKYIMKGGDTIVQEAQEAKQQGVYRYCMVASGRGPTTTEAKFLAEVVKRINEEVGIRTCLSVGLIDAPMARLFREAGLDRLNHNLNTSRTHTESVVSTHTYQDRVDTIRTAREAGLENCSGLIVGMDESDDDIVEVAYQLRQLYVASIPVNFLIPIPGNPLYDFKQLTPHRCLRILCMFRFVNPKAEIRVAGGREGHLRSLQALALYPANSLFVDGYLTTKGEQKHEVYQMIEDAGFELDGDVSQQMRLSSEKYVIHGSRDFMNPKTARVGEG